MQSLFDGDGHCEAEGAVTSESFRRKFTRPSFSADAKKSNLDLEPILGEDLEKNSGQALEGITRRKGRIIQGPACEVIRT